MKYFIDFEATQFTTEIISIGCIREDGKEFYSLIKPKKINTLTPFITNLTGITKEMLANEKSSDEVFEEFFDWLFLDNSIVEFYCYGNSDIEFLKKNLKDRTSSLKAQAALSLIAMSLKDYSLSVKTHFGLIKNIALKKVANYFNPDENYVAHNALEDAKMLKDVYFNIQSRKEVSGMPFPEYMSPPVFKKSEDFKNYQIERVNAGETESVYDSLDEAVEYIESLLEKQGASATKDRIEKRIMKAINLKEKYFNQKWIAIFKRGEE